MPLTTARTIVVDALAEIGVIDAMEQSTLSAPNAMFALGKLNRLLDKWNAERAAVYAQTFTAYTLVPSLSPHTIGPVGATWTVPQRPLSIDGASLILEGDVHTPITVRDAAWWQDQWTPAITSTLPTDVYYEPAWPLGRLYFWPVPTVALSVELETRTVLGALVLADEFDLPPGYREAITLTLAEMLARPFGAQLSPSLVADASRARAVIFAANDVTPRLVTRDAGMPRSGGGRHFNYLTGRSVH